MLSELAIGMALKQLRLNANKTLLQASKQCGHGKTWLSNIECGTRRLMFEDARTLCDFYGVTLKDLSDLSEHFEAKIRQ